MNSSRLLFFAFLYLLATPLVFLAMDPPPDNEGQIRQSIRNGDTARFVSFLEASADQLFGDTEGSFVAYVLREATNDKNRPLIDVYIEMLSELIKRGIKLTDFVERSYPLSMVVQRRSSSAELVGFLLDQGCDPNFQGTCNITPLQLAAAVGRPEIIIMLLAAGGNPELRNELEQNALTIAKKFHNHTAAELLSHQPSEWFADALKYGALWAIATLATPDNINRKDSTGRTPLGHALDQSNSAMVRLLISKGAHLDQDCGDGCPLDEMQGKYNVLPKVLPREKILPIPPADSDEERLCLLIDTYRTMLRTHGHISDPYGIMPP